MKKILMIIFIIFYIFQTVVLASDIDVGAEPDDRGSTFSGGYTFISIDNPANLAGTIDTIEIWVDVELNGVKIATFFAVDATHYTTRDTVTLGTVTVGEHSVSNGNAITEDEDTNLISLDIEVGDKIGIYYDNDAGRLEKDNAGFAGVLYIFSDEIPCVNTEFATLAGDAMSLKGLGDSTPVAEETNVILFQGNF